MRISWRVLLALVPTVLVGPLVATLATPATTSATPIIDRQHAITRSGKLLPHLSGGTEVAYLDARAQLALASGGGSADQPPSANPGSLGCSNRGSQANPRVNQDCTSRRQAEEQIAVNPRDPSNLIAGQNDSRIGFNHCGFDYSLSKGTAWGDGQPPFFSHFNPATGHTYDAASDPGVTVDGRGQAWFSCLAFDVGDQSKSAVIAVPSTPELKGSAYANVATGASPYVITENTSLAHALDKPFIAADPRSGHTTVYAAWTDFLSDPQCVNGFCSANIMFSKWNGNSWSKPVLLSGNSPLCVGTQDPRSNKHACDQDQGASPIVDTRDGSAFVVFNNTNTASQLNQTLGRRINADGSMGPIVKVGIDAENSQSLCDFGRGPEECVRQINVRTNDFPQLAAQPGNTKHMVAVWQDSRDAGRIGAGNYDVVVSESFDGGMTWTDSNGAGTVLDPVTNGSYFEPAVAMTTSGKVAVSDYQANPWPGTDGMGTYGYGLESRSNTRTAFSAYMPVSDSQTNPSPQANPVQAGFLGDYSGMAASRTSDVVYPIWSDTRNISAIGPDEDVFMANIGLK